MTREWKPGDVVWIPGVGRAIATGDGDRFLVGRPVDQERCVDDFSGTRALVVIDPEGSRGIAVEIAQRVGSALRVMPGSDISAGIEAVQTVLREFANPAPPKPDEPQGLGAVVEDERGHRWSRARSHSHGNNWREEFGGRWRTWDEFSSVRVVSEGVA